MEILHSSLYIDIHRHSSYPAFGRILCMCLHCVRCPIALLWSYDMEDWQFQHLKLVAYSSAGGSTHRPCSLIRSINASVACSIAIPRFTTVCKIKDQHILDNEQFLTKKRAINPCLWRDLNWVHEWLVER